jgi:hypothetical protein
MNARDFAWQIDRTIMASRPSIRIARKARSKAESDFATWLMMAKLASFDDLPPNAQGFLTNYRARRMSEAEEQELQTEAGCVDARPQTDSSTKTSCNARPDHTSGQE